MLRQYRELKAQHPGALLFFRLGDFYELFFDDAIIGARELQITLTARHKESKDPIPMCGVPHHSAANYIAKLVRKGYRVAICEQTEDASKAKKLVQRDVVRIVTPGTPIDPQLLEARETIYLAAVCARGETCGAAFLDLSTGEFRATQASGKDAWAVIAADVESYQPKELLFPNSIAALVRSGFRDELKTAPLPMQSEVSSLSRWERAGVRERSLGDEDRRELSASVVGNSTEAEEMLGEESVVTPHPNPLPEGEGNNPQSPTLDTRSISPETLPSGATLTSVDDWLWQEPECAALLLKQFGARSLDGYGITKKTEAIRAAGACLRYAQETQRAAASHITDIVYFEPQDHLVLDSVTVRNLELIEGLSEGATSLIKVIDETVTGMGARLLRSWLLRPSVRRGEIEARHGAVAELHASQIKRDRLRLLLKEVADVERLAGRLNLGSTTPRDLVALRRSLDQAPQVREALANSESSLLQVLHDALDELADVRALIESAIQDDPPAKLIDGGVIRDGYSSELDELRSISRDAKQIIAGLEAEERARTGIGTLRIRYNNVFGYFIEVSKANAARVPDDYERRQTLANAERFTTAALKEWEAKVLGAEERMLQVEAEVFNAICRAVSAETPRILATARALACLDALSGLAETAVKRRHVRPTMHDGDEIEIIHGRHPVIEVFNREPFIPNSVYLNNSTDRLLIITGPNMGGKSTILRQTAIISILAQMGSFVPAEKARLPLLDRVWTRVGASDDLARGRSTFMTEMIETAAILHNATPRSLVLLDEIGRGTATFDGLSIAWSVAEYLHDSPEHCAKTLFATHYHELTELAERLPGAQNYQITATEREGEVVFLHRLERGRASKSYGIEVARLAGMPPATLDRAREVLHRLERYELDVFADEIAAIEAQQATGVAAGAESLATDTSGALNAAATRAARRRIAAQNSLFDLANQKVVDELRDADVEKLSDAEAKALLAEVKKKLI
ncbi:MAG TPA: DNA mismatch repair protein MutS [Pyrinomonadaceae bacterium]|nr:DNA mismatch repair protein MutS [Pyrinomonadaceae bacterium]